MSRLERLEKILNKTSGNPYHDEKGRFTFSHGQGRGVGKPANSIDVSKYSTYEDFEQDMFRGENRKENIEKLKEQGINSKDKMYLYFVNEKFKKQKITQMSIDEAKDTILENIPKSVAEGWFIKSDSNYKKKIVKLIVENDNLRSASLSLAYETYKELVNKNIGFNDFLNKELDLYRGDPEGKKFIEADSTSFISYTPFEDMAKKFGKVITKKTIKPKETLGVLRQVGEFEFLVPTFNQKKDVQVEKDKTSKNSLNIIDYLRNNISAKSYFRSQRLCSILNKVNRGNPYHDEKGRFTSSHGSGNLVKENNATKIYEKYKDRKNPEPKSLSDEERELRIRTIINNAEIMGINLEDIKEDDAYKIMKFIGWEENKNGTVSTEFGLEKISDKEIKDDDYISFNGADSKDGFDALRDGGYRSKIIDEDDGPGIYTSEYYDTGLDYTKGQGEIAHEERVTAIKINNSNIISRDDVNKRLRNSNRNFLRNLPDSAVAALAGYDAMWTGNGDKEIVILKPSSAEIIELDEE